MEGRRGGEVLREGTSLRGKDIISELLLVDEPAPVPCNRFQTSVPLERMSDREISRRIELLTGYSTERLQELRQGGPPLEGHRLRVLAHLLIAKANGTTNAQEDSRRSTVPESSVSERQTVPVIGALLALLFAYLMYAYLDRFGPPITKPKSPIPTSPIPTIDPTPIQIPVPTPSPMTIFETRFSHLTQKFSEQKADVFDTLKPKLIPVVNQEGSSLLAIAGPSPSARAMAESIPWALSKPSISIGPLQFKSLGTEHRNHVINDVIKVWSERPDEVMILREADKLPPDVLDVIVEGCRTARSKNAVIISTGEGPGMNGLSGCGEVTAVDVTRETRLAQPPAIITGDHEASISVLKKTFPSQSARLWQVSDFVISSHLQDRDPRQPAMLILAGLPGSNRTVNQLAESLARIYSEEPLVINSRQYSRVDPARGKLHLDRALDSAFRGGRRAAVLTELDTLPPLSAMMLHSYCDHDNAQYKDVAYFMTLQLRESVDPGLTGAQQDRVVREHLREAWAELGGEKRDPLISRVATMIVLVRQEDRFDVDV
ncbi:uncharacterized protein LOC118421758 [Branchiostoma floridae]|uniref:Uncharacterized protein LOC118421758 n=1 Tax=Branchiostoma floridae TaxID=7739 RepID=A0A9J7LM67_BRAFL|nr:uncharacterized protein LOC118421758 [Branchiostoma floridae]